MTRTPSHLKKKKINTVPRDQKVDFKKKLDSPTSVSDCLNKVKENMVFNFPVIIDGLKINPQINPIVTPKIISKIVPKSDLKNTQETTPEIVPKPDLKNTLKIAPENFFVENKYNIDFEFYSLTFYRTYSTKYSKAISLQLNMCNQTYEYLNEHLKIFTNNNITTNNYSDIIPIKIIKKHLETVLTSKIQLWNINRPVEKKISNDKLIEKANFLVNNFIEFKKQLISIK